MYVGRVGELWRHPVKSMRGDRLATADVTEEWGVPGDRGWAVRDEKASEIRGAKQLTSLLQFHARYLDEPRDDSTPTVEITFPDGSVMRSDDDAINAALSAAVGREVTLWPRRPRDDHEHYRRGQVNEADIRAQLDLGPDEPLPDFSALPEELMTELVRYATPRGTYFDSLPLSLLTTAAMRTVREHAPESAVEPRRFRKNIILETEPGVDGCPEFDWVGSRLHIGAAVFDVVMPISRCVMVGLPQADLPHDRAILRSVARNTGMNLGVYLRALSPATIHEGDRVYVSEAAPTATPAGANSRAVVDGR